MNIICKHCGSDEGFYIKTRLYGSYLEKFNSDCSHDEFASSACDHLQEERGKNVYCNKCNKVICKTSEIEDELF